MEGRRGNQAPPGSKALGALMNSRFMKRLAQQNQGAAKDVLSQVVQPQSATSAMLSERVRKRMGRTPQETHCQVVVDNAGIRGTGRTSECEEQGEGTTSKITDVAGKRAGSAPQSQCMATRAAARKCEGAAIAEMAGEPKSAPGKVAETSNKGTSGKQQGEPKVTSVAARACEKASEVDKRGRAGSEFAKTVESDAKALTGGKCSQWIERRAAGKESESAPKVDTVGGLRSTSEKGADSDGNGLEECRITTGAACRSTKHADVVKANVGKSMPEKVVGAKENRREEREQRLRRVTRDVAKKPVRAIDLEDEAGSGGATRAAYLEKEAHAGSQRKRRSLSADSGGRDKHKDFSPSSRSSWCSDEASEYEPSEEEAEAEEVVGDEDISAEEDGLAVLGKRKKAQRSGKYTRSEREKGPCTNAQQRLWQSCTEEEEGWLPHHGNRDWEEPEDVQWRDPNIEAELDQGDGPVKATRDHLEEDDHQAPVDEQTTNKRKGAGRASKTKVAPKKKRMKGPAAATGTQKKKRGVLSKRVHVKDLTLEWPGTFTLDNLGRLHTNADRLKIWFKAETPDADKLLCLLCGKRYAYPNRTTSTVHRHLETKHPREWKQIFGPKNEASKGEGEGPMTPAVHEPEFQRRLELWIIANDQPFLEVDTPAFVEMIEAANPNLKVPSRKTVAKRLKIR